MVINMRSIFLFILCVLLAVSSVSAAPSLYYDDTESISRIGSGDLYFSYMGGEECVFAAVGTNVSVIWTDGGSALKLTAGETINDVCIGMDGLMYVTTTSGLYREAVGDCTNPRTLGDLVCISEYTGWMSASDNGILLQYGNNFIRYSYTTLAIVDVIACPHSPSGVSAVPGTDDFITMYGNTGVSYCTGGFESPIWTNGSLYAYSGYTPVHICGDIDSAGRFYYISPGFYVDYPDEFFRYADYDGSFTDGGTIFACPLVSHNYIVDSCTSYDYPVVYYVYLGDIYSDGAERSRLGTIYLDYIGLNATSYHRSDTARIDYEVEDLSTGTYTVVVRDPTNTIKMTETLTSPYGFYEYTFADNATYGNWSANLCLNTVAVETDYATLAATGLSSVAWDKETYDLGETGSISYEIGNYNSSTYDYSVDIYKAGILQTYLNCTSSSGVLDYSFSDITENTTYHAKLTKYVKGSTIPLIIVTDSCTVYVDTASDACTISFDKSVYGQNELVNMSYSNCPNGSRILFRSDSSPWYDSKTYESISGDGYVTYQLSGAPSGIGYYAKVYTDADIVIASDTMEIAGVVVGYCEVYGGIYDSQDYHPLIGSVFIGDSYSDVVGYNDYGAYSVIVPWGTYNISAAVSSYLSYNSSNVEISGSDYNLDMFLSVNDTTTHVFRGSVTDADSNAAIEDVLIKVYNDTFDEYDFTSQSGVWVVNGLTSGATYTLHATKDEYHSHTYSFTYDPGDFYYNFMMSLVMSEEDALEEDALEEDALEEDALEEDALEEDESMTDYFNEKFRGFAPTIWGFFMLMCLLFLMSILTSFNSGGRRR